jgi:hypothetical protein
MGGYEGPGKDAGTPTDAGPTLHDARPRPGGIRDRPIEQARPQEGADSTERVWGQRARDAGCSAATSIGSKFSGSAS